MVNWAVWRETCCVVVIGSVLSYGMANTPWNHDDDHHHDPHDHEGVPPMTGSVPAVLRGTSTAPDEEKGEGDPRLSTSLLWCGTGQLFLLPRSAKRISM